MMRLEAELRRLRMSQAQCARKANVNQTSMSRIIRGKEPPYPHRGKRIAEAIGWEGDPAELFKEVQEDES